MNCCYTDQEFVGVSLEFGAAVPEPSGALLFAVGVGCLLYRRPSAPARSR